MVMSYTPALQVDRLIDLEEVVGEVSSSESDAEKEQISWRLRSVILGTFVVAGILIFSSSPWTLHSGDLAAMQEKTGLYPDEWKSVTKEPLTSSQIVPEKIDSVNDLTGGKGVKIFSTDPLARPENLLDGNVCANDEELLGNLCYKKCSLLTKGEAPVRLSAFSCGKSRGFQDFFKSKVGLLVPCTGYDVSGDDAGKGCPHKAGTCLVNEEFSLGKCYKRCDELTDDQYPHRTSADTCCKSKDLIECIEPYQTKFSTDFNVGGGQGSFAKSHSPNSKFTELSHA